MQHWPECYCRRVVAKPSLTMHVSIVHPSWFFCICAPRAVGRERLTWFFCIPAYLMQWDVSDHMRENRFHMMMTYW